MKWLGALVAAGCLAWAGSAGAQGFYSVTTGTFSDNGGYSNYQLADQFAPVPNPYIPYAEGAVGGYEITIAVSRPAVIDFIYGSGFYHNDWDVYEGIVTDEGGSDAPFVLESTNTPPQAVKAGTYSFFYSPDSSSYSEYQIGPDEFIDDLYFVPSAGIGGDVYGSSGESGSYKITYSYEGDYVPSGVPEPSSWALLIAGVGLTGLVLSRRQKVVTGPPVGVR